MNRRRILLAHIIVLLVALTTSHGIAQTGTLDSLRTVVQEMATDSSESYTTRQRILSAYLYQAQTSNRQEDIIYAYQQLASANYNAGEINQALKFYKLYVLELEELTEFEEYREQQFEKNLFENEIRALKEQIVELENEVKVLEDQKKYNYEQNYLIYIGLRIALGIFIILFLGWIYQQYRKSKDKKTVLPEPVNNNQELADLLHKTKTELVSVQTEITLADMLVQQNITTAEEYFNDNKSFRRKFLLSLPKEITSGAGLYLHTIKNQTIVVMFNSASSGAAGGLLAAQIYHQLDELVINLGISSPSLILERLEIEINNLFPAGIPFAGGVPCGACLYNNSDKTILFCGANMDLFEAGNSGITAHASSAEPLLAGPEGKQRKNSLVEVERGSSFYLSTEAYWQQEGGHEYKPLGRESFEKTIVSMHKQSAEEQKKILAKVF